MEDSIFTKIIKGDIPCHKVYEDEKTLAFMDINPLMPYHTLLVPKSQVDDIEKLAAEDYDALMATAKKLMQRIKSVTGCKKVVMLVMGFDVPHAHIHLMPARVSEDFYTAIENRNSKNSSTPEELAAYAKQLAI